MAQVNIIIHGTPAIIMRIKGAGPIRRSAWDWFAVVIAVCFLAIGINAFYETVKFADLFYLVDHLNVVDSKNKLAMAKYATLAGEVVDSKICRSDILSTGLTFIMRDIDLQDSVANYDAWAFSLQRADRYVRYALTCNPSDGDLWVRHGMIQQAIAENPEELAAIMRQSQALAPSEFSIIRARFSVWRKASEATLSLSKDIVRHDIANVLAYAQPEEVKIILGNPPSSLKSDISDVYLSIPLSRRSYLKRIVNYPG